MKKLSRSLACGLLFHLCATASVSAFPSGSSIPSCHDDIAANMTAPGTGSECTPTIMSQEKALEILKNFTARKVNKKWYIFISEEEKAGKLDAASRWQTISLMASAVQSMFNENADCLLVRAPATEDEKKALLQGNYPQALIAAEARYVEGSKDKNEGEWPEYHHHLLYKITVY
ncbi:MAG: hypothetical protein BM485_05710 [Desulfobulbaceae bacterium DB1]|nr:MAG: hypothetical protein BM485_05710 [Desulfobulbaceae bacterium DB1]